LSQWVAELGEQTQCGACSAVVVEQGDGFVLTQLGALEQTVYFLRRFEMRADEDAESLFCEGAVVDTETRRIQEVVAGVSVGDDGGLTAAGVSEIGVDACRHGMPPAVYEIRERKAATPKGRRTAD
jgi:hypothetical protein